MALVSAIINRSLRLLNAIDAAASTPALASANAMTALNALVTRWEANGLALGWANVTSVDGVMPSPDEAEEAIVYNLAMRLVGEYPAPQSFPITAEHAKQFLAELRRDRLIEMPVRQSGDLPGRFGSYNIKTDEWN